MNPPEFKDTVSKFEVIFPSHSLFPKEIIEWLQGLDLDGTTEDQRVALALMRQGHDVTNRTYRQATGVDSRQATKDLMDLASRFEFVEADGLNKGRVYRLTGERESTESDARDVRSTEPSERPVAPVRDPSKGSEVLGALGDEELSRAEIEKRTGIKERTVLYWLQRLREDGVITATSENLRDSNTKYRRL